MNANLCHRCDTAATRTEAGQFVSRGSSRRWPVADRGALSSSCRHCRSQALRANKLIVHGAATQSSDLFVSAACHGNRWIPHIAAQHRVASGIGQNVCVPFASETIQSSKSRCLHLPRTICAPALHSVSSTRLRARRAFPCLFQMKPTSHPEKRTTGRHGREVLWVLRRAQKPPKCCR